MNFKEKLTSGKFIITSEIGPPKGIETEEILQGAKILPECVDAINVTDLQSSVMRLGSLAVCVLLKQNGFESIFQLTCRDRNRLALQSDLLSASALGIENVLVLTGDHPTLGDHPQAKAVFDLDSVQLLEAARGLMEGHDMVGNPLAGKPPRFCLGAVVNPGSDPIEPQILKMEKKIRAGAEFFQTQAVYDVRSFERFRKLTQGFKTKILAGIVLLKSAGMARYMNKNVAGVYVPDELIKEMEAIKDKDARLEKSVEIAARLIRELRPMCDGIHIMPLGWDYLVPKVLQASGLC